MNNQDKSIKSPLISHLSRIGETWNCDSSQQIELNNSDWVYWIFDGYVELFATRIGVSGQESAANHLCRLAQDSYFCGVPDDLELFSLTAVVKPGAKIQKISLPEFQLLFSSAAYHLPLSYAVDRWVTGIQNGLTRYVSVKPQPTFSLDVKQTEFISKKEVVVSRKKITWAVLPAASSMFMDLEIVPAKDAIAVPLSGGAWIKTIKDIDVEGLSTLAVISSGRMESALTAFHEAVMACLSLTLNLVQVDEANRLNLRDKREAADLRGVIADLAALVDGKRVEAASDSSQELFTAVDTVLRAMGSKAVAPIKVSVADVDSMPSIEEIVQSSAVRHREIVLEDDWWQLDIGPFLAYHQEIGTPLAVIPKGKHYQCFNSANGNWQLVNKKVAENISKNAVLFFNPLPDETLSLGKIIGFGLKRNHNELKMIGFASLVGSLVGLAVPSATAYIINDVIPGHEPSLLFQLGTALLIFALVTGVFHIVNEISLTRLTQRTGSWLKAALWDRLLRMPLTFIHRYPAGDLAGRMQSLEMMQTTILMALKAASWTLALMVSSLVVLFYLEWRAALVAIVLMTFLILVTVFFGFLQYRAFKNGEMAAGLVQSYLLELTTGIAKIRLAGAEERAFVNWGERFTKLRSRLIAVRKVNNAHMGFMAGFHILSLATVFAVIALINQSDALTTGAFLAFVSAYSTAVTATMGLASAIMLIAFQLPILKYVEPLLTAIPTERSGRTHPGTLSGGLEVNNLHFRYRADHPAVIQGVSLRINAGEFVAIVGGSGCGKSTLVKLLLGLERPSSGTIFYDQRDLRGLDLSAVRRQVGTVLQQAKLMPGTLFDNIRGTSDADEEAVWAAAKMAGIDEDIREMPMALQTLVTEASRGFSGGQIQRIAIARALVTKPAIVLFDEATSALDNRTQAVVTDSIEKMSGTRVVIAHRLSTIKHADRIVVMSAGKIVEQGSYEQLMAREGVFHHLAKRQLV